jgi:hypothetical protein
MDGRFTRFSWSCHALTSDDVTAILPAHFRTSAVINYSHFLNRGLSFMSTKSSSSDAAAGGAAGGKKPKSMIVKVIIGLLLVLMLIELVAHLRLLNAHRQLMAEVQRSENENQLVTRAVVDRILGNRTPDESKSVKAAAGDERYDIYYFWGLLKQRPLCVHYGVAGLKSEPELVEVITHIPDEVLAAN